MSFHGSSLTLGLQRSFQVLSVLGVFYIFYSGGLKGRAPFVFSGVRKLIMIAFIIHFLLSLAGIKVAAFSQYSGLLLNPNVFGMWVAIISLLGLGIKNNKYKILAVFALSLYLVYISGSRTSLLALIVGVFILFSPNNIVKSDFYKYGLAFGLFLISFMAVYFTMYFDLSTYNQVVVENTGKNLQSGRHLIWPAIIDAVSNKPWLGFGSGTNLSDIFDRTYSAHNAYLQTLMQNGFIGLFLMVLVLFKIYLIIYKIKSSVYFKVSLAMFSALIMINNFEIAMFQNNLALSYPVWAVIGLSLGHYQYQKRINSL